MRQPSPNPLLDPQALAVVGLVGSPACLLAAWLMTAEARADPLFGALLTRLTGASSQVICCTDLVFAAFLLWPVALRAVRRWMD